MSANQVTVSGIEAMLEVVHCLREKRVAPAPIVARKAPGRAEQIVGKGVSERCAVMVFVGRAWRDIGAAAMLVATGVMLVGAGWMMHDVENGGAVNCIGGNCGDFIRAERAEDSESPVPTTARKLQSLKRGLTLLVPDEALVMASFNGQEIRVQAVVHNVHYSPGEERNLFGNAPFGTKSPLAQSRRPDLRKVLDGMPALTPLGQTAGEKGAASRRRLDFAKGGDPKRPLWVPLAPQK